jgi:hypothetical protein
MSGWSWLLCTSETRSKLTSFKNAVYCYEELLLINPKKYELYQKLAELHFSIGSTESLISGRKYLCFLLTINPLSYRTLYALYMTCSVLITKDKKNVLNQRIMDKCKIEIDRLKTGKKVN